MSAMRQALIEIRQKISKLGEAEEAILSILGEEGKSASSYNPRKGRTVATRTRAPMSEEAKAKIAEVQKKRWAQVAQDKAAARASSAEPTSVAVAEDATAGSTEPAAEGGDKPTRRKKPFAEATN